jgi:hypothetical protein
MYRPLDVVLILASTGLTLWFLIKLMEFIAR